MATVNERLRDFSVARQIDVLGASNSETTALLRILRGADEALTTKLLRIRDPGSLKGQRLVTLQRSIQDALAAQHGEVRSELNDYLNGIAGAERDTAAAALNRPLVAVGIGVSTPRLAGTLAAMRSTPMEGVLLRDWVSRLHRADVERVQQTVLRGITIGQTTDEMVRAIVGTRALRFTDGVREVSRRGVRTLVRTATNHAANAGREAVWAENADLLSGVTWVATLDGRTTVICASLDGQVFPIGEGPRPPIHFACRSTTSPIVKGADELGLPPANRASLDGQVPETTTYPEWLRGRSAKFQDGVLGRTRGRLFRTGEIEMSQFIDNKGKLLNLDDLRRRVPVAFDEVGL